MSELDPNAGKEWSHKDFAERLKKTFLTDGNSLESANGTLLKMGEDIVVFVDRGPENPIVAVTFGFNDIVGWVLRCIAEKPSGSTE